MNSEIAKYSEIVKKYVISNYKDCFRESGFPFKYAFMTPGSSYSDELWDWDTWLSDIAIRQILKEINNEQAKKEALDYERGCILNFLDFCDPNGWIPIVVLRGLASDHYKPKDIHKENMHKPVLAQHAAFLVHQDGGDASWLRDSFDQMAFFVNNYMYHHRHQATGLYYLQTDLAIGGDNDPCTFYRPHGSSGSIFLNCMMYKELLSMEYLCNCLELNEVALDYKKAAEELKAAINTHCWDERDGFYYSVDLSLREREHDFRFHPGMPRRWDCLIQRIGVWSGFLGMWASVASDDQAKRIVIEHYKNQKTFNCNYGVRSLSKMEKMYYVGASSNPSNWLGPVWGAVNYLVFSGLVKYGYTDEAKDLAEKTILMFGKDIEKTGEMHEYYQPDNGVGVLKKGFKSWNQLVLNMVVYLRDGNFVGEF